MTERRRLASIASMTDPGQLAVHDRSPADTAVLAADAAARCAGVEIRELTDRGGFELACRLFDQIWAPTAGDASSSPKQLRALAKAGGYVCGAFDASGLVGASIGMFAAPAERALYSNITAVADRVRGRQVGFALKLHQRAWALLRGVDTICWTYDPLVRRNAHFNLAKLAAVPAEYLPNFYGPMRDAINGTDETDRLLVRWQLAAPTVASAATGQLQSIDAGQELAQGAAVALSVADDGGPLLGRQDGAIVLVGIPADIEGLRMADSDCASRWRLAVRDVLGTLLARQARVIGFDRDGWYAVATARTTQRKDTE